jgi:hypothetical protein
MQKWWILGLVFIAILVGLIALIFLPGKTAQAPTTPHATSTPQWVTQRGKSDVLRNISVHPGESVSSPLTITGEARGTWYFEASFPVELSNWDGTIIAQTPAHAQGDWMSGDYVPFSVTLTFTTPTPGDPTVNRGTLILRKDNPSGLPQNEDALEIPVVFK